MSQYLAVTAASDTDSWFDNATSISTAAAEQNCTAGRFNDGTCIPIWPKWVDVGVPLVCVAVFVLTLSIIFMLPSGRRLAKKQGQSRLVSDAAITEVRIAVETEQERLMSEMVNMAPSTSSSSSQQTVYPNGSVSSKPRGNCNGQLNIPVNDLKNF